MSKRKKFVFLAVGFLVAALLALGVVFWPESSDSKRMRAGDALVEKIERFRSEKKRLPESLEELGDGHGDLYYAKRGDDGFVVWFGKRLGESVAYDSEEKVWKTSY